MHALADLGRGSIPYVQQSVLCSSLDLDLDLLTIRIRRSCDIGVEGFLTVIFKILVLL